MDDERTLLEAEARVRTALKPSDAALRRVVTHALAGGRHHRSRRRPIRFAIVAAAALLVGVGMWEWWRPPTITPELSSRVVGTGSLVVVEARDGRRWIFGPPLERRTGGGYVIAVHK